MNGIELRGCTVIPYATNPFHYKNGVSARIPTTRLIISGIPLSHNDEDIMVRLAQLGVSALSNVIMEKDRDDTGKLLRWLTGNRIVHIEIPKDPLPKQLQMKSYKCFLYHKEQRESNRVLTCTRCLRLGHNVSQCEETEITCHTCWVPGHRSGDPDCEGPPPGAPFPLPQSPPSPAPPPSPASHLSAHLGVCVNVYPEGESTETQPQPPNDANETPCMQGETDQTTATTVTTTTAATAATAASTATATTAATTTTTNQRFLKNNVINLR